MNCEACMCIKDVSETLSRMLPVTLCIESRSLFQIFILDKTSKRFNMHLNMQNRYPVYTVRLGYTFFSLQSLFTSCGLHDGYFSLMVYVYVCDVSKICHVGQQHR